MSTALALDTLAGELSKPTPNAALAGEVAKFAKALTNTFSTGLEALSRAMAPLVKVHQAHGRNLAVAQYLLDSDEYIFCRDDSPQLVDYSTPHLKSLKCECGHYWVSHLTVPPYSCLTAYKECDCRGFGYYV